MSPLLPKKTYWRTLLTTDKRWFPHTEPHNWTDVPSQSQAAWCPGVGRPKTHSMEEQTKLWAACSQATQGKVVGHICLLSHFRLINQIKTLPLPWKQTGRHTYYTNGISTTGSKTLGRRKKHFPHKEAVKQSLFHCIIYFIA